MSEKENDLETAIQIFQSVRTYKEYTDGLRAVLRRVHSQEDLDRARKIIDDKKQELMENNTEFNAIMENRKQEGKQMMDQNRAIHKARMSNIRSDAEKIISDAMARAEEVRRDAEASRRGVMDSRRGVEGWISDHKIKTRTFDEAKKAMDDELGCPNPKCEDYGKNRGNTINQIATCMLCRHKLVPKSEFKNYNRKYWRRYNKKRK